MLKLVLVALAVVLIVALSVLEAIHDVPDPIDGLTVLLGLGVLLGVALRRPWLRPLGHTLGGMLVFVGMFGLFIAFTAHRRAYSPAQEELVAIKAAHFGIRVVVGALLLWCMRHRDVGRVLAEHAARRMR